MKRVAVQGCPDGRPARFLGRNAEASLKRRSSRIALGDSRRFLGRNAEASLKQHLAPLSRLRPLRFLGRNAEASLKLGVGEGMGVGGR